MLKSKISKKKWKIRSYIAIVSLFFVLLTRFYDQLGLTQIILIIANASLCVAIYKIFKLISNQVSRHAKIRTFYGTSRKLIVSFVDENKEVVKSKRIWKYENIINAKLGVGFLLVVALDFSFTYIFTFVHEISHAIATVVCGGQVHNIVITASEGGYIEYSLTAIGYGRSIVYFAGSFGSLLFGIFLLIAIYRKKKINLDVFAPIYFLTSLFIIGQVMYWHKGALQKYGDPWYFIKSLPQMSSLWLANFCVILFYGMIFCLTFFFVAKIVSRLNIFLKKYIPDLSDLNSTIFS